MLFGIPAHKDSVGSEALHADGIVQRGLRALKQALPELITIADICMCESIPTTDTVAFCTATKWITMLLSST